MTTLVEPQVLRCYFDQAQRPAFPTMHLAWDADMSQAHERVWHMPHGVQVRGAAPEHFGIQVHRLEENGYKVKLRWNQLFLHWNKLTRLDIMSSSLALILRALGTDLWDLLQQPVEGDHWNDEPAKAA